MKKSYTYIMTNRYRTTFYVGVTANLPQRILEHAEGKGSKFTTKYNLKKLIYFNEFIDIKQAIAKEKQLKNWHKALKLNLIKERNLKLKKLDLF